MKNKILLLVDCQHDFIDGSLAVDGAKDIMDAASRFVRDYGKNYSRIMLTCDNHPYNHISFNNTIIKDAKPGPWPPHCIENTVGAAIYEPLWREIYKVSIDNNIPLTTMQKGKNLYLDEYSAFHQDSIYKDFFTNIVEGEKIDQIDIFGICGDVCVKTTISDLITLGMKDKLCILETLCPSLDGGNTLNHYIETEQLKCIR